MIYSMLSCSGLIYNKPGGRFEPTRERWVKSLLKEGRRFAVDVDLSKFFDRVLASTSHFLEHRLKLTVNTTICGSLDPTHRCRVLWELGVRSPPGYPIMFRFLVIRAVSHSARLV